MIGVYKITNNTNNKSYIGISVDIPTTDCAGITGLSYNMTRRLNASYEILNATLE